MRTLRSNRRLHVAGACARRQYDSHRGVTLLEVVFSIGIVAVGLLGVLIIVPLAGLRTAQGTIADGADRLGRNAVRTFDVYQMRRPESWAQLNPSTGSYVAFTGGEAFCIDPLLMAEKAGTVGIHQFPFGPPSGAPWMKRVTLRTYANGPLTSVMSKSRAAQIFFGDDDLVVHLPPEDRTLPPEQKFDVGGATTTAIKRQWEGKFTWFATVVPRRGYGSDLYLLSIVVAHRRELECNVERTVNAAPVPAGTTVGYSGGDVLLTANAEDDLEMKEGEWLMLTGIDGNVQRHFQWYRIQTTDAGPAANSAGTGYERDVTLFGQDWPFFQMTGSGGTRAVWIPGIVAVYEKTIRLETSSLWTNL